MSVRFVSTFDLQFKPTTTCLYVHYSVSYTKIKARVFITYEDGFINVKIYIALNSEMCINTQFKKICNQQYQMRYMNEKIGVAARRFA